MTIQKMFAVCLLGAAFTIASTPARADSDVVHFFSDIHVAPDSTVHDAVCFFCSVNAEGGASGDIVVFFGNIHIANRANHDVVDFFGEVSTEDNAQISHDLVNFFGMMRLGENVSVGGDMVAMFGLVSAPESVTVDHDRVAMPAWIIFAPFIFVSLVLIFIVRQYRAYRWRQYVGGYPFPPGL